MCSVHISLKRALEDHQRVLDTQDAKVWFVFTKERFVRGSSLRESLYIRLELVSSDSQPSGTPGHCDSFFIAAC